MVIVIRAKIMNAGAPTGLHGWTIEATVDGHRYHLRPTHFDTDVRMDHLPSGPQIFPLRQSLEYGTLNPVRRGQFFPGWIAAITQELNVDAFRRPSTQIALHCLDAFGNGWTIKTRGPGLVQPPGEGAVAGLQVLPAKTGPVEARKV